MMVAFIDPHPHAELSREPIICDNSVVTYFISLTVRETVAYSSPCLCSERVFIAMHYQFTKQFGATASRVRLLPSPPPGTDSDGRSNLNRLLVYGCWHDEAEVSVRSEGPCVPQSSKCQPLEAISQLRLHAQPPGRPYCATD